mgnify:CR=1 FL=1
MSSSYNRVILLGNTTRDTEVRFTQTGLAIARLSLAVNSKRKSGDTMVDEVLFVDCTAFGRTAETIGEYVKKGNLILIEGRLQFQTWEDKNTGARRSKHEVLIDRIQFMPRNDTEHNSATAEPNMSSDANDEVPF